MIIFFGHLCRMHWQKNLYRERMALGIVLALVLIGFGVFIAMLGKGPSFRMLTAYHSPEADLFFRKITHLGDGIFILALAAVLALRKKYFLSIGIVGGYLVSGLFAQLGKKLLNLPRPRAFFEAMGETVYQVPGLEVHMKGSFPSGHTASVFALAIFLILALPYRWYSWIVLAGALLVGYSRIYLSQHFPIDVWAGAMIGTISGTMVFGWMRNFKKKIPNI